jgi:hypothetical protein
MGSRVSLPRARRRTAHFAPWAPVRGLSECHALDRQRARGLTLASPGSASGLGRLESTDRARREPASRRSGTGAVSGERFSRNAQAGASLWLIRSCLCNAAVRLSGLHFCISGEAGVNGRRRAADARSPIQQSAGSREECPFAWKAAAISSSRSAARAVRLGSTHGHDRRWHGGSPTRAGVMRSARSSWLDFRDARGWRSSFTGFSPGSGRTRQAGTVVRQAFGLRLGLARGLMVADRGGSRRWMAVRATRRRRLAFGRGCGGGLV